MKKLYSLIALTTLMVLLSAYALLSHKGWFALTKKRATTVELTQRQAHLDAQSTRLLMQITTIQNNRAPLEGLARKRFGLIGENEVFYFVDKQLLQQEVRQ